jgi:diadenosine tetraphosphate (Ap4A) HIT family hydrolase/5-methylcytosine-specific restriction endonuclease McrA
MSYQDLIDFLENKMRLSHVYQPLLIKSLIESGGSATIRQLANAFLSQDERQLQYYEDRIKQMPLKVLRSHDVVSKDGDLVFLRVKDLTFEQKAQIKMICEKKMQDFIVKRGLSIWDYRLLDKDPVPDSLYYRVLKESGGRCALCGATKMDYPLHVDHIRPRSRGGKTGYENLQVLCSKCNQVKSNKDDTDFRGAEKTDTDPNCRFCPGNIKDRIVEEWDTVLAFEDRFPVSEGHLLIVPKRHAPDWFLMTERERREADDLIRVLRNRLSESDKTVTGFNVGMNCGASAGQTIFHAHIHLIPRRDGDTPNPTGGVRGVIPDKMCYCLDD